MTLRIAATLIAILACAACQTVGFDLTGADPAAAPGNEEVIRSGGPSDEELQRRLSDIYSEVNGMEHVDVRLRHGVAHVSGTVENVTLQHEAIALARRMEGVVYVANDIRIEASDRFLSSVLRTLSGVWRALADMLPRLIAAVVVFAPFLALSSLVRKWRNPLGRFGVRRLTASLIRTVVRGALLISGLFVALDVVGIVGVVGALIGALGLLGLAAGILFKDWLANYFPAVLLGMHPPFKTGDLVQIGDHEGRVVKITPRATVLLTMDGEELRLPNTLLIQEPLINFSEHRERRLRFIMPLSPRADLGMAQDIGCRALLALRGVKSEPPPFCRTQTLHRDAVDVEFFASIDQDAVNYRAIASRARRAVFEALCKAGVPLPTDERELSFKVADSASPAGESESAEAGDDAFIASQLERVRERLKAGERDLLER